MQNFHEHQAVAHGNSWRLLASMCFAVIATVMLTGFVLTSIMFAAYCGWTYRVLVEGTPYEIPWGLATLWYAILTMAIGAAVVVTSYYKARATRMGGGASIAQELGGIRLDGPGQQSDPSAEMATSAWTQDADAIQLMNVVAEMAIAAQIPPPQLYLLPGQSSINAFAVGFHVEDAVIGISEGALRKLNREELQGVIAHEFAHILNGDMRANLELLGYLHGTMAIATLAQTAISMGNDLVHDCHSERRNDLGLALFLIVAGVLVWPIGMIGHWFAMLIKAAFCRQREFLADAYAVQFTRNPAGIAGALKRILGHREGSRVRHPLASECSHLFFAKGDRSLLRLFQTHPPISERVRRIEPHWDGIPYFATESDLLPVQGAFSGTMNFVGSMSPLPKTSACRSRLSEQSPSDPETPRHIETFDPVSETSKQFLMEVQEQIPEPLRELAHSPDGAPITLVALLLSQFESVPVWFGQLLPAKLLESSRVVSQLMAQLSEVERLVLLDGAFVTLRADRSAARLFAQHQRAIIDGMHGLPEEEVPGLRWTWKQMTSQLARDVLDKPVRPKWNDVAPVLDACAVLLSSLVYAGSAEGGMRGFAMQRMISRFGVDLPLLDEADCSISALDHALSQLVYLTPQLRRDLLVAAATAITSDQSIGPREAYLLRGIASALDFDPAHLLPGQPVAVGT